MGDTNSASNGSLENAEAIIERFGGIRPMASKMDVPVTTVQGWKKRNVIPENRRADVIKAARSNNIEISDLVGKNANQNTSASSAKNAAAISASRKSGAGNVAVSAPAASQKTAFETEMRAQAATPQASASSAKEFDQEAIINKIKAAEKRAVRKSLWGTISIIAITGGALTALLLWPIREQTNQNTADIASVRMDVAEVNESVNTLKTEGSFLSNVLPADLEEKISALQSQAEAIQSKVTDLSSQAGSIAQSAIGPDAGNLEQRLTAIEGQLSAMTGGNANISAVFDRLRALTSSASGQDQISAAVAQIGAMLKTTNANDPAFTQALASAQKEEGALGTALEGVEADQLKAAAMLLALTQVRSSLHREAPFADDLALMLTMLDGQISPELAEAVSALAPKAQQGILSPAGVSEELRGLAGDIVVASLQGDDVSVKEKALARLNDVLQVQKDGELVSGTDTQATIARAQKHLDAGNVQNAIIELQKLEGGAADAAKPVLENAAATLLAERLEGLLNESVASKVNEGAPSLSMGGVEGIMRTIEGISPFGAKVISSEDGSVNILPKSGISIQKPHINGTAQ